MPQFQAFLRQNSIAPPCCALRGEGCFEDALAQSSQAIDVCLNFQHNWPHGLMPSSTHKPQHTTIRS